jgi:hypothetical protein
VRKPSVTLADGTVENGDLEIKTGKPAKARPADSVDLVGPVTPAQAAAIEATYESAAIAAKAAYPDFQEVMDTTE